MKNMVKIALAAVIVCMAASCTKEYYTQEYYEGVKNEVRTLRINANEWAADYDGDENIYYYADFDVPEITKQAMTEAVITVYRQYRNDFGELASQSILPSERHFQTYLFDEQGKHKTDDYGNWIIDQKWTETIDYEFYEGGLTIYFTTNDFALSDVDSMEFRVVITY